MTPEGVADKGHHQVADGRTQNTVLKIGPDAENPDTYRPEGQPFSQDEILESHKPGRERANDQHGDNEKPDQPFEERVNFGSFHDLARISEGRSLELYRTALYSGRN